MNSRRINVLVKTTHGDRTENVIDFSSLKELMEVSILEPTCISSSTSSSKSYPTTAPRKSSLPVPAPGGSTTVSNSSSEIPPTLSSLIASLPYLSLDAGPSMIIF